MTFYVRADGDPEQVLTLIPPVVAGFDPNLPAVNLRTVSQQVRENVFLDRFVTTLTAFLAVLATFLAAVGLYGVSVPYGRATDQRNWFAARARRGP